MYSLLKPPKFGNCRVVEGEKPLLDPSDFKALISADNESKSSPPFVDQVKKKLDNLISLDDWECEDVFYETNAEGTSVADCVLYYLAGFLSRKMRKATSCTTCRSAFSIEPNMSAEAALTNIKKGEA